MILDLDEPAFLIKEEEASSDKREPMHEEAVKALLVDNSQLFVDILVSNSMEEFTLPLKKIIEEAFSVKEPKEHEEYRKKLNQKILQLLQGSEVDGRYFQNQKQISLHNYINYQYFECDQGPQPQKQLLDQYRSIFQKITQIDDLVCFMDYVVVLQLEEDLHQLIRKNMDVLNNLDVESDVKIIQNMATRNEEEKHIIRLCLAYMVKYFGKREDRNRVNTLLNQHLIVTWARLFSKWSEVEGIKRSTLFSKSVALLFSLFPSEMQREEQFPHLMNFQSQFSKALFEALSKVETYPCSSKSFRGMKYVLFRWAMQLIPDSQELKNIIKKLMNCFFDDDLNIKVNIGEDLFETPALCRNVKKIIGLEFMDHISKRHQIIAVDKIKSSSHPLAKRHQLFFYKLGLLINSRILGEQVEVFAFNMMNFYLQYAHIWPILHTYRMWILQVCKESMINKSDEKIDLIIILECRLFQLIKKQTQNFAGGYKDLSQDTTELLEDFSYETNLQINQLRLKRNKNVFSKSTYQKYFDFMLRFEEDVQSFNKIKEKDGKPLHEENQYQSSVERDLYSLLQEFKVTIRYAICNSNKFLGIKDEQAIMQCMGEVLWKTIQSKSEQNDIRWKFICDIFGLNQLNYKSTINKRQIMGPMQRYTAKLHGNIDEFVPFNMAAAFYFSIRNNYKLILRFMLDALLARPEHEQLWEILEKVMLPSVLISGSCFFNGQTHQKTKEELAFGLYYDQFEKITEVLTETATITKNIKILVLIEQKKRIFSNFYSILRTKNTKIVERVKPQPEGYNRYRRNMSPEDVIQALSQMGVSREEAEIALENIDHPDHNVAMDWIDNNQDRIEEILVARTVERTRQQRMRREMRSQPQVRQNQIAALIFERFNDKDRLIKLSRSWIKIIFKELFKDENSEISDTLKTILFLFMDSLKPENAQNQYNNLNEKLYQDLDSLNKKQNIERQLLLVINLLEGTFQKTQKGKKDFYQKAINLKVLSYLQRIKQEKIIMKIFSLINSTLPIMSSEGLTEPQELYMAFLLDKILLYRSANQSQCQIMLKIAKTGKETLMKAITRNINVFFKENLIQQSIFSLINIILTSDKELSNVNAELDLKTYLFERYSHRLESFKPEKEHVLEIDINEFQKSFQKYDRGSAIYEVIKAMLLKKKNKNKLFFYDCRKEGNQFDYSFFGKSKFLNYPVKEHFKTMIRSFLLTLFSAKDLNMQNNILTDLFKLLYSYRILIPFTIHEDVCGKNLIQWLLCSSNHTKRKYKFLAFLTTNVNIFIQKEEEQSYKFLSLSDYICAKIIKNIVTKQEDILWSSFNALYLSQIKKFNKYCSADFSSENNMTLVSYYQNIISKVTPLEYINISEFLYINYKKKLLDNLKHKYKINSGQQQTFFEAQFLSLSSFYQNLGMKKVVKSDRYKPIVEAVVNQEEMSDQQEEGAEMMYNLTEQRIFSRNQRPVYAGNAAQHIQPLLGPIRQPVPPPKQENKQEKQKEGEEEIKEQPEIVEPIVIKCEDKLDDIIVAFEKYLVFDIEVNDKFELKEAQLPNEPVIITNFNQGFTVKIEEVYVDLDLQVKKMAGFEKKIGEIFAILVPKGEWQENKEKIVGQDRSSYNSLGRRLIEHLSNPLENNRDTLMTLERLIQGRYSVRQEPPNPFVVRNLNLNDVYPNMAEFVSPIVPPQPEPPREEAMEVELPAEDAEKKEIQQPIVEEKEVIQEPVQGEPAKQQEIVVVEEKPQEVVVVEQKPEEKEKQEVEKMEIQYQPLEEESIQENEQIPLVDEAPKVENPPNLPQEEENINPVPVSNAENSEASQPPAQPEGPPPREREILSMLGLPQTFLRDVGLDEEFFDSLPEDLQQEQLMTFMAQQGASLNRGGNNGNNPQPNQPQDLQSENTLFLQSLDPHTRAQVLLDATPEMLASLPANYREQAERQRSLQINRIIEEEDIEEQRRDIFKRSKDPLVYPKVFTNQFSKISEEAAQHIFRGIFNIYPKFKLTSIKILLENKHLQQRTIASIIALIRSFEQEHSWSINKVQIDKHEISIAKDIKIAAEDMVQIKTYLLHTILEQLKIPIYRDQDFLTKKIEAKALIEELDTFFNGEQFIDPIIELTSLALNYYPDLATQMLKKSKDLPDQLFREIVAGIRKEEWPHEFYESLSNFSENERLKIIFQEQFEEKPPKIQILGKVIKYKFSHLPSLKKIHQQALQNFSPSHIEFLNQIFAIYTVQDLNEIEPLLIKHKQIHFDVIKTLYQMGRQLDKEPIGIILKKSQLIDFETKKFIFRNHPKLRKQGNSRRVHIQVDRAHLFQGSYNQLMNRTPREIEGKVQVAFINQPGYDAGGIKREWFLLVSREIFNQDYALFEKSSSGSTYQPNPKSYINPDHLNYFKFIGRFIGKSLVEKELIDAYFTRAFYKMILGQQLEFKDLEAQDYEFYKSMEWLKNNPIDENTFTFSYIYDNFGKKIEKEMVEGGKDIVVNEDNKKEYIEKYCMSKMRDNFESQMNKFLQGFYEIIPQECISFFQAKELQLLISGVPEVDLEDFKRNTDYSGYNPTDQIIIWFWEVVSEYAQQDLAKLIQFITGTSKIPLEGFSHLIGMNGIQRISIHRDPIDYQLPKSHTCFNQLDLPNYKTKEILKSKLGICLAWGSQGFGFM